MRSILTVFALIIAESASAARVEPAVIPPDVRDALVERSIHTSHNPLPDAIDMKLAATLDRIGTARAGSASARAPQADAVGIATNKADFRALRGEAERQLTAAHEDALRRGAHTQAARIDGLRSQIAERFDRVDRALDAVETAGDDSARGSAMARAASVLRSLRRPDPVVEPGPISTFRQGEVPAFNGSRTPARRLPQYLARGAASTWSSAPAPGFTKVAGQPLQIAPNAAAECGYTAADLDTGASAQQEVQVPATSDLRDLASALDYSPVRIFKWVYENIAYEPYYGSLKGALPTLWSRAGNDTDQASLLIALLRVSNVPARYVLGVPDFRNDARVARWVGAKTMTGAANILGQGYVPVRVDSFTATTILQPNHVWVEACVPYSHYRGARTDAVGHRWIPLDPSFKDKTYQAGITHAVTFNYAGYLARRTNGPDSMPHEAYAQQVEASLPANATLKDVPYKGTINPLKLDVLPASLPFDVVLYLAWPGTSSAEASALPDAHRYKLKITLSNAAGVRLSGVTLQLPEHVLHRITVSPRGVTPADAAALDTWRMDGSTTTSAPCTINVLPVLKVEGVDTAVPTIGVGLCSTDNRLNMQVLLPERGAGDCDSSPISGACVNRTTYTNISAAAMLALQAYAFQASDRHLNDRAKRLIDTVRATANANANLEETEGEFFNIVGLKYMRHFTESNKSIGQLDSGSGESGNHLGLVSAQIKVAYVFDLPFAVNRKGFLVDVLGGLSRNVDLSSGSRVFNTFLLSGYAGSAYESYVWQENARLDAVSTVRGLQFANETGIGVFTVNSSNWSTVRSQLAVFPGVSATDCTRTGLAYARCQIDDPVRGVKRFIDLGYTVKLPKTLIQYGDWKGMVYEADRSVANANDAACPSAFCAAYAIATLGGGVSVNGQISMTTYNPNAQTGFLSPGTTWSAINPTTGALRNVNGWQGMGSCEIQNCSGDPVHLITGNVYHVERDISIPGRGGLPIVFERSYNSRMANNDSTCIPIGCGWTHSFNHTIKFYGTADGPAKVSWVDGTGNEKFFSTTAQTAGNITLNVVLANSPGVHVTFRREANGTYTIKEKNGLLYTFASVNGTAAGGQRARLLSIADRNANTLTMTYTGNDLTSVKDGLKRSLNFAYVNGRIAQVTDFAAPTPRSFTYSYEADGDLASYRNAAASLTMPTADSGPVTYTYYTAADGKNLDHALKQYRLPNGNGMAFEYYANARAFRHSTLACATSPGSPDCQINTFTYNDFRRETVQVSERGLTRTFLFDQFGNAVKIIEENGAEHDYTYDGAPGNRLTSTDPLRYKTTYTYDAKGNVTSVKTPRGATGTFDNFTAFNEPQRIKDASGNYTVFKYDAKGNLKEEIRLRAGAAAPAIPYTPVAADVVQWTQVSYDAFGNRTSTIRVRNASTPAGANPSLTVTYDANGLYPIRITRSGDKNGDGLINASDPPDSVAVAYDELGRLITGIDPAWHVQTFTYDLMDRRSSGTDAAGKQRSYSYDRNGNMVEEKLIIGGTTYDQTQFEFDASDRLVRATAMGNGTGGARTSTVYDAAGNALRITNADGLSVAIDYDEANHPIRAADEAGNFTFTARDVAGRPRCVLDANGNAIFYTYWDASRDGRLKRMYVASQRACPGDAPSAGVRAMEYDYDANGNVISISQIGGDGSTRVGFTTYDALNRPVRRMGPQITDPTLGAIRPVVQYTYNLFGYTTQIQAGHCAASATGCATTPVLTLQQTNVWDDFGRKIRETDAAGKSVLSEYDVNNNVTRRTDAKGDVTTFAWAFGHRLTSRINPAAGNLEVAYNNLGQVQTAATRLPGSTTTNLVQYSYTYDNLNRLDTITDSRGPVVLDYDYSQGGRLKALRDNAGNQTNYLYDAVGRLSGIWAPNYGTVSYRYDAGGRLREKWLPNGVNAAYAYNADGNLVQIVNRTSASDIISQHDYVYDTFGNRQQATDLVAGAASTFTYAYDALDRLVGVKQVAPLDTARDEIFTYDILGNLTQRTVGLPITSSIAFVYDATNQLLEARNGSATGALLAAYAYDANGSLLKKCEGGTLTRTSTDCTSTGGTTTALTYDALGQLVQAVRAGGTENYSYDHEGRRIVKTVGGTPVNYVYNGPDIHAEYGLSFSAPLVQYAHGPDWDDPVMRIVGTGAGASTYYYHQDGLGSIVAVSTASGAAEGIQRFDAWGNRTSVTGNTAIFGYTGREPDSTGLIYYRARYYDPSMRRFLQRDPIGLRGGMNLYAYAGNNPVNVTDPQGLYPISTTSQFSGAFNLGVGKLGPSGNSNASYPVLAPTGASSQNLTTIDASQERMDVAVNLDPRCVGSAGGLAAGCSDAGGGGGGGFASRGFWSRLLNRPQVEAPSSPVVPGGGLVAHEAAGGHLLARHVGKTQAELAARLSTEPHLGAASTFATRAEAEAAVSHALNLRAEGISKWASSGPSDRLMVEAPFSGGTILFRGASSTVPGTGVRVILQGNGGGQWHILTGHPIR